MSCTIIIPGTYIVCGEGGNFCSDECLETFEKNKKHLERSEQSDIIEDSKQSKLKQK